MANIGVSAGSVSRTSGINLSKGTPTASSTVLPSDIGVFAEVNTDNQGSVTFDTGIQLTSAKAVGDLCGYGSPAYHIARILFGTSANLGGIPVTFYPIQEAGSASASTYDVSATGTATGNATHTLVIAGRRFLEGGRYDINIETGDTTADIATKIYDTVSAVLGCPVTATLDSPVTKATLTSKWKGASSVFNVTVDTNGNDVGITYTTDNQVEGAGVPAVTTALSGIANDTWHTHIINGISNGDTTLTEFEAWNGVASNTNPTGRFVGIVAKPAIVFTGAVTKEPEDITSGRRDEMTISIAPAPGSGGFHFEAAANMVALYAPISNSNPHIGCSGQPYPDMPVPSNGYIGVMSSWSERDRIVKLGCSTVDLQNGAYLVEDMVTTYRPEGEEPPQWRYVRDLIVDFNIIYGFKILERANVIDKVIANSADIVTASNVIKPSQWKQILFNYADSLTDRALIADPDFMKDSITVAIDSSNPNRLNTEFSYKRTGRALISSTMAFSYFNFG